MEKSRSHQVITFRGNPIAQPGSSMETPETSRYNLKQVGVASLAEGISSSSPGPTANTPTVHYYDPKTHSIGQAKKRRTPSELRSLLAGK
jgi:hypothetical protein